MRANLNTEEFPRYRCLTKGASTLSLRECLALLLNSGPPGLGCLGLAEQILEIPGRGLPPPEAEIAFFSALEASGAGHFEGIGGLGDAGKARLLAAFELGRRYSNYRLCAREPRSQQTSRELRHRALAQVSPSDRSEAKEWLGFIAVHRSGRVGRLCRVESGARTHVNVDPTELFARILALRPQAIYLVHNHPSGDPTPSVQDIDLTSRVGQISKQLGIELLGHWIVTVHRECWLDPYFARSDVSPWKTAPAASNRNSFVSASSFARKRSPVAS